jgi:hypothetical protein
MSSTPRIQRYYQPVPQINDASVQAAAQAEISALKKRKGFSSTLLTGGEGVTQPATTQKTLLGQ